MEIEEKQTSVEKIDKGILGLFRKPLAHIILVIIFGLLAYSNSFNVPFHFDDMPYIVENSIIREVKNFIGPYRVNDFSQDHEFRMRYIGYLTFALDYKIHGTDVIGYHVFNLIIHILNAVLVYYLIVLTFKTPYFLHPFNPPLAKGDSKDSNSPISNGHQKNNFPLDTGGYSGVTHIALFSALLFVSHPIQTQAVTYITQRFTSLATLFYLLSLVSYVKWRLKIEQQTSRAADHQEKRKNYCTVALLLYCASLISAILAMKTKEISFTLPFIISLYEFMFFEGKIGKKILYLVPILLTMLIIPLSLIDIDKSFQNLLDTIDEVTRSKSEIPRLYYLFTQARVIVTYLRLLFLPIGQNLDYDYPVFQSFLNQEVFISCLFLISIFIFAIYSFYVSRITHHALRLISFGIFWFFITLSVESSIIPITDLIFEHRIYLPSIGVMVAFVFAVSYISRLIALQLTYYISRFFLTSVRLLLFSALIALSIATFHRNAVWSNEVSLWEDNARKSPQKDRVVGNLAYVYIKSCRFQEAIDFITDASTGYSPRWRNSAQAYETLGVAYLKQKKYSDAYNAFSIALTIDSNKSSIYTNMAALHGELGEYTSAMEASKKAVELDPYNKIAYNNLGLSYASKGDYSHAINMYKRAIDIDPSYDEAHYNLALAYITIKKKQLTINEYIILKELDKTFADKLFLEINR